MWTLLGRLEVIDFRHPEFGVGNTSGAWVNGERSTNRAGRMEPTQAGERALQDMCMSRISVV